MQQFTTLKSITALFTVPECSQATALQAAADTNDFHTPESYESLTATAICLLYHVTTALLYLYSSTILMWCRCIKLLHPCLHQSILAEDTRGYSCTQVFKESLNGPNTFNSQKCSACKLLTKNISTIQNNFWQANWKRSKLLFWSMAVFYVDMYNIM